MKKVSQTQWVANRLERSGKITRNQCLRRYISRLAARIADLRDMGWEIEGRIKKTNQGQDYEYKLISKP